MENLYTKINDVCIVCMHECMRAYSHVYMYTQQFLFFLNLGVIACMAIPYTGLALIRP